MTGYGRRGKPKTGFPPRPQPLEIANNAIPTFPQPLLRVEKWKTKSRFPTFPLVVFALKLNRERKPSGGSLRSRLQAHPSIRKCLVKLRNSKGKKWASCDSLGGFRPH